MLDNNIIQSTSSWPFVEIRKLLKDRRDIIKGKNKIKLVKKKKRETGQTPRHNKLGIIFLPMDC